MRIPPFAPFSIRAKMTLAALIPLAFTVLLVWGAALYLINAYIVGETQKKVRQELNAARAVLQHEEDRIGDVVRFTAHTQMLSGALQALSPQGITGELQAIRRRENLDILTLTDADGTVLLRSAAPEAPGGIPAPAPVFNDGRVRDVCGPVLFSREELLREGEGLAEKASLSLRPPLPPGRSSKESRGMLLVCTAPVTGPTGEVLGHLYGGVLLNRNLPLVDRIKELVYGVETYHGTEIGSATLFLGDLRVATTVRLKGGERALGTRVSPAVAEAVLDRQEIWLARARVVDDWYLTAYEPIIGPRGKAIGALYVGQLEQPFTDLKLQAALTLLALLLLGSIVSAVMARSISKRISRPILDLEECATRVAAGERDICVPATTRDEIGVLSVAFNHMTAALKAQEDALQELNRELEGKVRERTAELEDKSWQLIRTREELARSEKLAAIGSLAAGVAHEINNPAAIIRGNVEILLSLLPQDDSRREEAMEILKQTERISNITQNMLAFARRQALHSDPIRINELLTEVLGQIGHQVPSGGVEIRWSLAPEVPPVEGDGERLRQVFTNLALNALQAMDGEGTLTVATRRDEDQVVVEVSDTGPGIPADLREKIFDPFFTTRRGGTGLGLSVSYGIVQAMHGTIDVESEDGKGATFRVRLPARQF